MVTPHADKYRSTAEYQRLLSGKHLQEFIEILEYPLAALWIKSALFER